MSPKSCLTCPSPNKCFRFGNFIGEEADVSEEESERGVDVGNYVYDDGYPEEAPETTGQELMEIDGLWTRPTARLSG